MRKTYQSIWIELPYAVIQITDVRMTEGMNCHACLQVTAICEDDRESDVLNQPAEREKIQAGHMEEGREKTPFFTGRIQEVSLMYEKGQLILKLTAASMTQEWDIVRRSRTFQNTDASYEDVIRQVLSAYPGASWISSVGTKRKIPGFLLQYEETDWEFLCRLASHFEAFLLEEPAGETGQIYFGIPEQNRGGQVDSNCYQISQNLETYRQYAENVAQGMMLQDNLDWLVSGRSAYKPGETVLWNRVSCQVVHAAMQTEGAEIRYIHGLKRTQGVKAGYYGNRKISGLSLPAVIKERNGNRLRVHFSIDPEYRPGNNHYFTYAIETTSWYCLPEPGSTVHIYFQNQDETTGIAVQAMRQGSEASAASVSARGAVEDKSFSTSDGKAMQFTGTGISFSSVSDASCFTVSKDGTLNMEAADIVFSAQTELNIGKGMIRIGKEVKEIIPEDTVIQSETGTVGLGILDVTDEEVTMKEDRGILIDENSDVWLIASGTLFYEPEQMKPPGVRYSDTEMREEDAAQREAHNAEVFAVREKESRGKIGVGKVVAGLGALCVIGAATVLTGGVALVALGAGITATACGTALEMEGRRDLAKMESGDFSQSCNFVRDGLLGGNQELYETVMYGSVMIGLGALLSPLAKVLPDLLKTLGIMGLKSYGILAAGQALTAGSLAAGTMYLQDVSDGYVDAGWQEYGTTFGVSAAVAGIGFALGTAAAAAGSKSELVTGILAKSGKFAPALIIGGETIIDVAVDKGTSVVFDREFDLKMSLLTSLASNIAFSIDPVNMATGGFCLTATDLLLPDLMEEHFRLQRIYNSVIPCAGGLGKNWMLGLESRLFLREEEGLIDAVCTDGHAERFRLEDGKWISRRQGDARYQLKEAETGDGFVLLYIPEHKRYDYDSMGRLLSIRGKGLTKLSIRYQEAQISQVVTSSGYVLDFRYEGDRIAEIRDEAGRTLRYRYENGRLTAVSHVDEGVTTYHYDEKGHITQVVDQNGHAYVRNEYDDSGRVTAQYYPDGTKSILTFDPRKRENTVYIEGLERTERYWYNKDHLVTHTYHDDGTLEETGYDQWSNRIFEKDRNGNVTRRLYDGLGRLLKETLPSGQTWEYRYGDGAELLEKRADTGEVFRYTYDEYGFVIEESEKIREGAWRQRQYRRDSRGRVLSMTDSLGRVTRYDYDSPDRHFLPEPSCVEDASGGQTVYEYDILGRRTAVRTDMGTAEIRYNRQNYPTCIRDGNGIEQYRTYDKMGNLTALFPPAQGTDGPCWTYRYDFFDRLVETRDPMGNIWKKERNLSGDILCEQMPDGREIRYEYDADSRKIRTVYADGSTERCFYDGNGNLIKKVRPENYAAETDDGIGVTYVYDSMNRLVQVTDEDGQIQHTFHYSASGRLEEESDGAGYATLYMYDLTGNRTGMWEPVEMSDGGEVLYRVTLYEYDSESNKIREKRGLDKVRAGQNPLRTHELRFTYDARNRLTMVEDPQGSRAEYRYNSLNQKTYESFRISEHVERVIRYEYDAVGNLIRRSEGIEERFRKPGGSSRMVWSVTRYEYDPAGNCIYMVSPKGHERTWQYDILDRVTEEKEEDQAGGIHRTVQYEYDPAGNLLVRRDCSLDRPTERRFDYDGKDRLIRLTDESGAVTRLFYDRNDRITKAVRPQQYDAAQDDGAGFHYIYDCRDRVTRITGPDGNILQEHAYDRSGNIQSQLDAQLVHTEYEHSLSGDLRAVYRGRRNAQERRAAQRLEHDAWGNVTGATDGNGNRTDFVLDGWGRILEIHTPEGGVEHYTYDYAGNITSTTDANGNTIIYRYNSFGQVCEIRDPEGHSEYFYCDEEGRQETHVDRNGNTEHTHYNMDGSLFYRRCEDRNGKHPVVSQYRYRPDGRLREAIGGGITYQYAYMENGLLESKSADGIPLLEYAYDRNRNLSGLTDCTGRTVCYAHDALNRLMQITEGPEHVLASYHYHKNGPLQTLCYGNGLQTEYHYQEDGSPAGLVTMTAQGNVLLNLRYAYDGNGNCTEKSGEPYQNIYTYDRMNRLTRSIQDGKGVRYAYDPAGNRLKKETGQETETYRYNAKNQLTERHTREGVIRYRYDLQGNLLEEQGETRRRQYAYDAAGRQISVAVSESAHGADRAGRPDRAEGTDRAEASGSAGHAWKQRFSQLNRYDGENLRYETEENGKVIRFLFDRGELAEERREDAQIRYIRGYDPLLLIQDGEEQSRFSFVQDETGSTLFLLDEAYEIRKSYHYDPFGDILQETGDVPNRLTYTGQMYDGTAGQYYLRARFYNPVVGRFLQEDTYRGDGMNLYAYCANNPVMYYDPSGYVRLCPGGKTNPTNNDSSRKIPGQPGVVTGGSSQELGENMFEEMGLPRDTKRSGYQAQHIIPVEAKDHPVIKKIGMDLDDASNGIFLRVRDDGTSTMTRHQGRHTPYNKVITEKLNQMDLSLSVSELDAQVYQLREASRAMLESGIPIYPIDNEPRIPKLKNASNKIFGVKRGVRTMNLIERWLSRYGG